MGKGRLIRSIWRFLKKHWLAAVALGCIAGLVIGVNPSKLATVLHKIDWRVALLMVPVTVATYILRGTAWWLGLRKIGERITLIRCLGVEFAGQVMIFLPMGDLARVAMARRADKSGPGAGTVAGTIAFQELIFLTLVGLGVLPRLFIRPGVVILVAIMTIAHVGIFTILLWKRAYQWALHTVERIHFLRRFDTQLRQLQPTFVELFRSATLVPILVLNVASVLLTYLLFYLAVAALGATQVGFVTAAFVLALSYILAALSFLPGGLGVFEGLLTVLMIANGVPAAVGAAASLIYRGYNDVLMAMLGALAGIAVRKAPARRSSRTSRTRSSRATDPKV
ncbi:MAG TPA: lysylphosphatidylglycerol synthase transmembrane domain-containing protein [Candidatus Dormibacteraeota bacterium]